MNLTEQQWLIIKHFFSEDSHHDTGRPPADPRSALNGILWVLGTGKPWNALPPRYPSRKVCRERYLRWKPDGLLRDALLLLDEDLQYRVGIRASDPTLEQPDLKARASWWWQTALLLRSPAVLALLHEEHAMAPVMG
jgi:transposase